MCIDISLHMPPLPLGVKESSEQLATIFNGLVPDLLRFVRKNLKETVTTVNNSVPALSDPGVILLAILLLGVATVLLGRREQAGPGAAA